MITFSYMCVCALLAYAVCRHSYGRGYMLELLTLELEEARLFTDSLKAVIVFSSLLFYYIYIYYNIVLI